MSHSRNPALDLARFVAALIVFSGHLFFLPISFAWDLEIRKLLSPIQVGDSAVLFFYALSGYVLTINKFSNSYLKWVLSRLKRLYPIYIVSWTFGFFLLLFHDRGMLNFRVLLLGIFGFQALDSRVSLVVNAPLWSLSVEILFTFILFYLISLREKIVFLSFLTIFSLVFAGIYSENGIVRAAPYFLIGILLRTSRVQELHVNQKLVRWLISFFSLYFVSAGANLLLLLPRNMMGEAVKFCVISLTLFLVSKLKLPARLELACIELGKRSFCLYAFHYPVLLVFNYLVHPENVREMFIYVALSSLSAISLSEVAYRVIDRPMSKKT